MTNISVIKWLGKYLHWRWSLIQIICEWKIDTNLTVLFFNVLSIFLYSALQQKDICCYFRNQVNSSFQVWLLHTMKQKMWYKVDNYLSLFHEFLYKWCIELKDKNLWFKKINKIMGAGLKMLWVLNQNVNNLLLNNRNKKKTYFSNEDPR